MKYLFSFILFLNVGCSSMAFKKIDSEILTPKLNEEVSINVGETFLNFERMTGTVNIDGMSVFGGSADKFDLRLRSASNNKIVLDYSEYFKPNFDSGYAKDGSWSIKPAFNKTLEYDLNSSKKVVYEKFEFEVSKVDSNKITYKRVK